MGLDFLLKSSVPYGGGNVIQKNFLKLPKPRFGGTLSPLNGNRIIVILWPTNLPKLLGNVIFTPYSNENNQ